MVKIPGGNGYASKSITFALFVSVQRCHPLGQHPAPPESSASRQPTASATPPQAEPNQGQHSQPTSTVRSRFPPYRLQLFVQLNSPHPCFPDVFAGLSIRRLRVRVPPASLVKRSLLLVSSERFSLLAMTLPTLIDLLIGMADLGQRIEWQPIPLNTPVAETSQRNQVGVASPCPHRRLAWWCHRLLTEPAFDRFGSNVCESSQTQFVDHSLNQPLGSRDVRLRPSGRSHRGDEFGEMIGQRGVLMIGHRILGGRDDA